MNAYHTEQFNHAGLNFRVDYHYDDLGAPWEKHDGHGVISDWTMRDKRPGERVLVSDRRSKRYYDIQATQAIAVRDGWSCEAARKIGAGKRQAAAMAVEEDFQRMQAWCNTDWYWCGIVVTLLDLDGEETNELESLWGIESDSSADYFREEIAELAEQIAARVPVNGELVTRVREAEVV